MRRLVIDAARKLEQALLDWLIGGASDRHRFQEMHDRFRDAWVFGALIGGCSVLAAATYGWWLVSLPLFASVVMASGVRAHPRARHPEVVAMVTFALLELDLAVTVLLSLMVVPVFTQAVSFRPRVTAMWVVLSAVLTLGVVLVATGLNQPVESPALLNAVTYLALLGCLSLAAHYLAEADVESRDEAAQDALTGLLNRHALGSRFAAMQKQLRTQDEPLTLLMVDVDHFKRVNDSHGHQQGDLVLQQLAHRLVTNVRAEDLVFRLGGEEFLVLVPGLPTSASRDLADRLNAAVAERPLAGIRVTISVGMASEDGRVLDYDRIVGAADAALYRAKREGRNCVRVAA